MHKKDFKHYQKILHPELAKNSFTKLYNTDLKHLHPLPKIIIVRNANLCSPLPSLVYRVKGTLGMTLICNIVWTNSTTVKLAPNQCLGYGLMADVTS